MLCRFFLMLDVCLPSGASGLAAVFHHRHLGSGSRAQPCFLRPSSGHQRLYGGPDQPQQYTWAVAVGGSPSTRCLVRNAPNLNYDLLKVNGPNKMAGAVVWPFTSKKACCYVMRSSPQKAKLVKSCIETCCYRHWCVVSKTCLLTL